MGFPIIHYESEGDYPIRPNDYFYCAVYNATVYSHNNTSYGTAKPGIRGPGYSYNSPNYPTMRFLTGYYSVLFLIITVVLALFKNVTTVIKEKN